MQALDEALAHIKDAQRKITLAKMELPHKESRKLKAAADSLEYGTHVLFDLNREYSSNE